MINAWFMEEVFNVGKCEINLRKAVYRDDVLEIMRKQVLLAVYEEMFLFSVNCEGCNGDRGTFLSVNSDWLEHVQRENIKRVISSGRAQPYWNEKSSGEWSAVGIM